MDNLLEEVDLLIEEEPTRNNIITPGYERSWLRRQAKPEGKLGRLRELDHFSFQSNLKKSWLRFWKTLIEPDLKKIIFRIWMRTGVL